MRSQFQRHDRLTAAEMTEIVRALARLMSVRGDGLIRVTSGTGGIVLGLAVEALLPRLPKPDLGFWARITASTVASDNQWTYAFEEVVKTSAGYDRGAAAASGLTGTAYNSAEDMNAAAGVQGNGVDVANLDTADYTFALRAAPAGLVVWMRRAQVGEATEYWFQYENGVDGSCD